MIHPQHATSAIVATEVNDLLYNSTMATAAIPLDLTTTPSSEALPPLAFEVEIVESTEFEDGDHSLDSSEVSLDETSQVIPLTKVQSTGSSTTESISMYSDQISGYSDDTSCYSDSYSGLPATTTSVVLDTPIITQTSMPSLESTSYEPLVVTSDGTVIVATETPVVPLETPIDLTVPSTSSASAVLSVDVPVSADGTVDETLARAAMEAVTTGKMTLLIKEELRCTIQTKRLSEGKDELEVTVDDKVEPEVSWAEKWLTRSDEISKPRYRVLK